MKNNDKYLELVETLRSNHFYPKIEKLAGGGKETITGLFIFTPSILKEERTNRVREIIGEDFRADYMPNREEIFVQIKSKKNEKQSGKGD